MKPIIPINQDQIVKQKLNMDFKIRHDLTEKLAIPGIENLHLKSAKEISEVLANVIKSRVGIKSFNYVVGQYIEITSESDIKV